MFQGMSLNSPGVVVSSFIPLQAIVNFLVSVVNRV